MSETYPDFVIKKDISLPIVPFALYGWRERRIFFQKRQTFIQGRRISLICSTGNMHGAFVEPHSHLDQSHPTIYLSFSLHIITVFCCALERWSNLYKILVQASSGALLVQRYLREYVLGETYSIFMSMSIECPSTKLTLILSVILVRIITWSTIAAINMPWVKHIQNSQPRLNSKSIEINPCFDPSDAAYETDPSSFHLLLLFFLLLFLLSPLTPALSTPRVADTSPFPPLEIAHSWCLFVFRKSLEAISRLLYRLFFLISCHPNTVLFF